MTEREKKILDRLAKTLPYMPEAMKERLLGYGDCMAEVMRQQSTAPDPRDRIGA